MLVLRSKYDSLLIERSYWRETAEERTNLLIARSREVFKLQDEVEKLTAEIADRRRSETDTREQLRELQAKLARMSNRGAGGRFVKAA